MDTPTEMMAELDAAIETLTARLTKGADMIWEWEQQGRKGPRYRNGLNLFCSLLAEYEMKCDQRARRAVPVQPSLMDDTP